MTICWSQALSIGDPYDYCYATIKQCLIFHMKIAYSLLATFLLISQTEGEGAHSFKQSLNRCSHYSKFSFSAQHANINDVHRLLSIKALRFFFTEKYYVLVKCYINSSIIENHSIYKCKLILKTWNKLFKTNPSIFFLCMNMFTLELSETVHVHKVR